ncbi:MAG: hypothetical protein AAB383_00415 [Patescibacteria group bacterium]
MKQISILLLLSFLLIPGCSQKTEKEPTIDSVVEQAESPNDSTNEF